MFFHTKIIKLRKKSKIIYTLQCIVITPTRTPDSWSVVRGSISHCTYMGYRKKSFFTRSFSICPHRALTVFISTTYVSIRYFRTNALESFRNYPLIPFLSHMKVRIWRFRASNHGFTKYRQQKVGDLLLCKYP